MVTVRFIKDDLGERSRWTNRPTPKCFRCSPTALGDALAVVVVMKTSFDEARVVSRVVCYPTSSVRSLLQAGNDVTAGCPRTLLPNRASPRTRLIPGTSERFAAGAHSVHAMISDAAQDRIGCQHVGVQLSRHPGNRRMVSARLWSGY